MKHVLIALSIVIFASCTKSTLPPVKYIPKFGDSVNLPKKPGLDWEALPNRTPKKL